MQWATHNLRFKVAIGMQWATHNLRLRSFLFLKQWVTHNKAGVQDSWTSRQQWVLRELIGHMRPELPQDPFLAAEILEHWAIST